MHVAVCVTTLGRPRPLARTLQSLAHLVLPPGVTRDVVVVDNDASRSAEAIATSARVGPHYVCEPQRGYASARNRALQAARALGADWLAFIDDDEEAHPEWLLELLAAAQAGAAEIVTGPVLPLFEEAPPRWLLDSRLFDRERHPTGTELGMARTGNVLLARRIFETLRFQPSRDAAGGEDTAYFMTARAQGARIVWSDRALVFEWQPSSRMTLDFLLRRAYRAGVTYGELERELRPGRRGLRVASTLFRLGSRAVELALPSAFRQGMLARALTEATSVAGVLAGTLRPGRRRS